MGRDKYGAGNGLTSWAVFASQMCIYARHLFRSCSGLDTCEGYGPTPSTPPLRLRRLQDYRALRSDAHDPAVATTVSPSDTTCVKGMHHPIGLGQGPGQGARYANGYSVSTESVGGGISGAAGDGDRLMEVNGLNAGGDGEVVSPGMLPPPGTVTLVKPRIRRQRLKVGGLCINFCYNKRCFFVNVYNSICQCTLLSTASKDSDFVKPRSVDINGWSSAGRYNNSPEPHVDLIVCMCFE